MGLLILQIAMLLHIGHCQGWIVAKYIHLNSFGRYHKNASTWLAISRLNEHLKCFHGTISSWKA
uniref:Secreted protein n=1 Tax=Arundo donax TaxID=35708 RepID=A0A0A9HBZ9_ARUDO